MRESIKKIADNLNNFKYKKSEEYKTDLQKEQLYSYTLYKNEVMIKLGVGIITNYKVMKLFILHRKIKNWEDGEVKYLVEKINEMGDNLLKKYDGNVNIIIENRLLETIKL